MVAPEVVEGVSGAAAGMAATVVTYPLMTVSTLQATRSHKRETVLPSSKKAATGTIADILEVGGWLASDSAKSSEDILCKVPIL